MRIAPFVAATALSLASSAFALTPNCEKACTVIITMSAACGSGIKVAPDPVVVPPNAAPEITWSIQSDGWAFDGGNGIVIFPPGDAFEKGAGSSKSVKFRHKNKEPRVFKYDVNMVDTRDNSKCKLDPNIVDQ
jgi:hypothetical protein